MGYFYTLNPIAFHHDAVSSDIPHELRYTISDEDHKAIFAAMAKGKEIYETPTHALATRDYVIPTTTVDQALAQLAAYRYDKECAGIFFTPAASPIPILFASDRESRSMLTDLMAINSITPLTDINPWKAASGFINLTRNEITALGLKTGTYTAACYAVEETKQALVKADPTVDIRSGWPANT